MRQRWAAAMLGVLTGHDLTLAVTAEHFRWGWASLAVLAGAAMSWVVWGRRLLEPVCWIRQHQWRQVLPGTWADPWSLYCARCRKELFEEDVRAMEAKGKPAPFLPTERLWP